MIVLPERTGCLQWIQMQEFRNRAEKVYIPRERLLSRLFPTPVFVDLRSIRRSSEEDLAALALRGFIKEPLDSSIRSFLNTPSERPPISLWIFAGKDGRSPRMYVDLSPIAILPVEQFGNNKMLYCGRILAPDKINLAARAKYGPSAKIPAESSLRWSISEEEQPISIKCEACRGSGKYRRGKTRGACRACSGTGRRRCRIRRDEDNIWLALPEHLRGKRLSVYLDRRLVRRGTPRAVADALSALKSQTRVDAEFAELKAAEELFNQELQHMRDFIDLEQSISIGDSQTLRISNPAIDPDEARLVTYDTHGSTALWEEAKSAYLLESADSQPRKVKIFNCGDSSIKLQIPAGTRVPFEAHLVSKRDTRPFDVQRWSLRWWMRESAIKSSVKRTLCAPQSVPKFSPAAIGNFFNSNIERNSAQRRSVELALSEHAAVSCIQGPPGTGKTSVIVEIIRQHCVKGGGPVLVASQSNLAVDNVLERLIELPDIFSIRLGRKERVAAPLVKILLENAAANFVQNAAASSDDVLARINLCIKLLTELLSDNGIIAQLREFQRLQGPRHDEQLELLYSTLLNTIDRISTSGARLEELPHDGQIELEQIEIWASSQLQLLNERLVVIKRWKKLVSKASSNPTQFIRPFISVIGATCIGSDHSFLGRHFDKEEQFLCEPPFELVILDEVGRSTPMESLVPMQLGQRIVLVGDHKQLPPVVSQEVLDAWRSSTDDEAAAPGEVSLFELLVEQLPAHCKTVLQTQFRMHPQIADFIAEVFYQDEQLTSGIKAQDRSLPLPGFSEALSYHSTRSFDRERFDRQEPGSTSRYNEAEVEVVLQLLSRLDQEIKEPVSIGTIAFYMAQAQRISDAMIKMNFRHIQPDVSTLDAYQGQERDIIVLSLVRCPAQIESFNAEWYRFFLDVRRLNVALSRARRRLMIVGDIEQILKVSRQRETVPGFEVLEQLYSYIELNDLEVPLTAIYES